MMKVGGRGSRWEEGGRLERRRRERGGIKKEGEIRIEACAGWDIDRQCSGGHVMGGVAVGGGLSQA